MSLNNSQQAIIDNRRRQVAILRLRGLTQREIVSTLAGQGIINIETGKPWSLGIINRDLSALEAEWRAEAAKATEAHKAQQLAELDEVRRAAWRDKDLATVLKVIKQKVDITGTNDPIKIDWRERLPEGFTEDDIQRQFAELLQLAAENANDND